MKRLAIAVVLGALLQLPASAAGAGMAAIETACSTQHPADAPSLSYRFCDDGVPPSGGRTPNPGGVKAVEVPAAYYTSGAPTGAPGDDGTIDGLPPAAGNDAPTPSCSVPGAAPTTTPLGTCTVALDVDVTLPAGPAPPGGRPVVVLMHGCCSGNKTSWETTKLDGGGSENWHYGNAWFATRGYVVVTYTSRGFVDGQGHGSTGETQIDSEQYEVNDLQSLVAQMADDDAAKRATGAAPFFDIDPRRVVVTGGSYGGGLTWLTLADPVWTSPGGTRVQMAAAAPKYGWTDLVHSLVPTGHHFYDAGRLPAVDGTDSGYDLAHAKSLTAGIPIRTIIAALYAAGTTGVPPGSHATFPTAVDNAFKCTQSFYPPESAPPGLCEDFLKIVLPNFLRYNSAYYRNGFFGRVSSDPDYRVPIFSAGTHTDPLFPPVEHHRMAERLKQAFPGYPIKDYFGDYQHFTNNKRKEWSDFCGADHHVCTYADYPGGDLTAAPAGRVRVGITTLLNEFIDHYARPEGDPAAPEPAFDTTASLQVCAPNATAGQKVDEPGETFTAASYDELTPGLLGLVFSAGQTTTSKVPGNPHAADAEPVAAGGGKCPVEDKPAGAGVAVYDSPALPSDVTMIGGGIVSAPYSAQGGQASGLQLNARLYDVAPDAKATLVDRGPYRIPEGVASGTALYQLHGNGWRFPKGHVIRLELAQDDDPYLKSSDIPSSLTLGEVKLALPVREQTFASAAATPGSPAQVVAAATFESTPGGGANPAAADRTAPRARMRAPFVASSVSRSARFPIAWSGSDIGSGVKTFEVQVRRTSGRKPQRRWTTLFRATTRTSTAFDGHSGQTYAFRVRAVDRAGNVSPFASGSTIVPTSERTTGARYSGPWRVSAQKGSFGRRAVRCAGKRCRLTLRWRGAGVALIGATGPSGGRLWVTVDGPRHSVPLRTAKTIVRRVLLNVPRKSGRHRLTLVALRGQVVIDGFALRNRRG